MAALVLVLSGIRFAPRLNGFDVQATAREAPDLRLMTFNAPTYAPDRYASAQQVVQLMRTEQPHVIALQEADMGMDSTKQRIRTSTQVVGLLSRLNYQPPELPSYPEMLEQPVIAQFPLLERKEYAFPFPWGVLAPTRITQVRFRWDGERVTLLNMHLHTVSSRKPWTDPTFRWYHPADWIDLLGAYREGVLRRAAEARRIRQIIEETTDPLLVTGDFNSTPHNWAYRHIAQGLQDAYSVAGTGWGGTYPSVFPIVRIDHVLASAHWKVISARVPDQYALSDHRAVRAVLQLRDS